MGYYLDDTELYLFNVGSSSYAYRALGSHTVSRGNHRSRRFAVWAPHARAVSVVGTFNGWDTSTDPMHPCGTTGVWEAHIDDAEPGMLYKYAIVCTDGKTSYKADPFAVFAEKRPGTASVVWDISGYEWQDQKYMAGRALRVPYASPMSIYEVHMGSWKAGLTYRDLAEQLVRYVKQMGYTHIELMPLSEYPLDASWGYQVTGYYAVTSRYGTPQDFMYFVDRCHEAGIGVILDWVPSHFPKDAHGLRRFDGSCLYEHPDPRRSEQPQWGTLLFDYGRTEVQSFLISNAVFFLNEFHIDGLRVDAVSCMLYLDYGKQEGEWLPNEYGGRENPDAVYFLRKLSRYVGRECPGALLIAEESTAFPLVTAPPEVNGLGFNFKWNMGFMNDTLSYIRTEPVFRKWEHNKLTFSMMYAFAENFILPYSHDEVVHGKKSLLDRIPGDYWQKFAQLRLLYSFMFAHPGKKLMFMGDEFGHFTEWRFDGSLDWVLLDYPKHREMQRFVCELNNFYVSAPALFECDSGWEGFRWLCADDCENSVLAFLRQDKAGNALLCAFNFNPFPFEAYSIKLPFYCELTELLSSDEIRFGGTGQFQNGKLFAENSGQEYSVTLRLPPYAGVYMDAGTLRRGAP
ncbi:MAG: 1,4-alpha-glucan branching enzyme GlgB [Firmicutes bacterium ADurb.Bin182]|nr:MAG: 1,4-alpha-glucan branching enzyme GlgB [Firmicutes bacterium ADurb.Bin182]